MVLKEVLFLKASFPRPLHPKDPRGPEVEATPMPGVGRFRIANSRDRPKDDRFPTDLVHTKFPLKLKHTSKSLNERQIKNWEVHDPTV